MQIVPILERVFLWALFYWGSKGVFSSLFSFFDQLVDLFGVVTVFAFGCFFCFLLSSASLGLRTKYFFLLESSLLLISFVFLLLNIIFEFFLGFSCIRLLFYIQPFEIILVSVLLLLLSHFSNYRVFSWWCVYCYCGSILWCFCLLWCSIVVLVCVVVL